MTLRNYSSTAVQTTLSAGITNVATTMAVAATTGFPSVPFIGRLDGDTASEELVLVTNVAGLTLTMTRGYDSTSAQSHSSGCTFRHSVAAVDLREPNVHIQASTGVHGVGGVVVGTSDTQALTNKTISASTLSGTVTNVGTVSGGAITGATITGGSVNVPTLQQAGSTVATLAGTETLTNKTLTTPTVASLANANHTHTDAAGGGSLTAYAKTDGSQNVLQGTTTTAFQVRANAAPAADMFAVTNSAGAVKYLAVTSTGAVTVAGVLTTGDTLTGTALSATHVPIIGKGAASQSANLLELRDSASVMQFAVDSGGSVSGIAGSSFGAWTAYTPTLTAVTTNPTLGSTGKIEDGYWTQVGKTVFFNLRLQFGTSGVSTGSGSYIVTLPVAPLRSYLRVEGYFIDASPTTRYMVHGLTSAGSTAMNIYTQTATPGVMGNVSPTNPVTFAVSDSIHFSGSYEVA